MGYDDARKIRNTNPGGITTTGVKCTPLSRQLGDSGGEAVDGLDGLVEEGGGGLQVAIAGEFTQAEAEGAVEDGAG